MKKIALVCMMLAALCLVAFAGEAVDVNARKAVSKEATPTVAPEMKVVEATPAPVADAVDIMAQIKALEEDALRLEAANDEVSLAGVKAEIEALLAQLGTEERPVVHVLDATGDDCTDPIVVTLPAQFPYSDTNTNCGRLNTYSNTCLGSYDGGEDIIYRIDVTSDVVVNISLVSVTTYKGMAIDEDCPLDVGTTECIAKITGSGSPIAMNNVSLVAGTYYIMIDTWPSPNCIPTFTLNITNAAVPGRCCYRVGYQFQCVDNTAAQCTALGGTWSGTLNCTNDPCPQPPANDLCTGAIDLSVPGSITGDNTTALNDTMVTCGAGGTMGAQLWYRVTGDGTTYTASTCDAATTFDTEISVWVGDDCGNLTCVGSNDDAGALCALSSVRSTFSWCALPGVRYYIAAGSYSYTSGKGTFVLSVTSDGVDCTDPLGRCCYGDPEAPSCADVTESECVTLGGEWTVGLNCTDDPCPLPFHGDDCTDPLVIAGLPYTDARDNTGATNVYDGAPACFTQTYYDDGAEVVYELTITEKTCIVATLDQGTDYDYCSLSLWAGCPDVGTCLWGGYASSGVITMPCTELNAGVYYIMVDNWPTPDIFEYTLTVDACECPSPCESYVLCGTPAEIEPNDVCPAPAEQAIIGCDATVYGLLCPVTDVDYWMVVVPPMTKMFLGQFDGENCDVNPTTAIATDLYYADCSVASVPTTPNRAGWTLTNSGLVPWVLQLKVKGTGISQYKLTATCCPLFNPCDAPIVINAGYTYHADVNTCPTDPCGTANVVPGVWEDACAGSGYSSGPDVIFMLTLYETANDIDITATAAGTGDEQVMVFTDCLDPMGTCVGSQDMFGNNAEGETISNLVLVPGTYYISVSYYGSTGCGDIALDITSDVILPVEFGDVDAVAGDRAITLNWNTITETNTDHFEIVRDGVVKGRVDAAGNSTTNRNYSWTEDGLDNGVNYTYTLKVVDVNGAVSDVATVNATPSFENGVVTEYALHQNYPNPFNPATTIAFDLKDAGFVNLKVYNLMGQEVATVMNGSMVAGRHMVTFDASNLSSGIYLYRIEVNGFAAEKKMLLMK